MHTKRISVGYGKGKKWVTTPSPGPHKTDESIPLLLVVRDMLGYADNSREAKKIIQNGLVMVDKKVRKNHKFSVGLMDIIDMPKIDKHYRVLPQPKGLKLEEINAEESKIKLCKITGKRTVKGGKTQLSFHDGTTIQVDGGDYNTDDTIVLKLPEREIQESIKFNKDNVALIVKGRHSGASGKITDTVEGTATRNSITTIGDMQTLTEYSFVIGADKPMITV